MPIDKTFDPAASEAAIMAAWEDAGAFAAGANKPRDETFCIMIPPPNVNGRLHIGHAFNNTLQDILTRWHRMRGFDTLWQPGQDHAGIALQRAVEQELAATGQPTRKEMGRAAFVESAWDYKTRTADGIINQLKRIGASCDWSRNAFTMAGAPGEVKTGHENSPNFHDAVLKVFVDFYNKGLIYRGKRLVNWDPHFETAISDLEVENTEVDGHMWHFKYPLAGGATYEYVEKDEDGTETLRETRDYISIATTRPETMLGDGAVAVHPSDERYAPIVGQLCEIPVGPKEHRRLIPIITDSYPDPDFGSGAVKITGAHDFNDYEVAKRGNIPMYRLMDTKGALRDDGAPYAEAATRAQVIAEGAEFTEAEVDTLNLVPDHLRGLDRFDARKRVIDEITKEGLAVTTRADDPRLSNPPKLVTATGGKKSDQSSDWYGPDVVHFTTADGNEGDVWQFPEPVAFRASTFEGALEIAAEYYQERGAFGYLIDEVAESFGAANAHEFESESGRPIQLWAAQDARLPLVEAKKIMQPFGDRSKVVIEPMLTDQWFVDTAKIVQPAIDAVRDGRTKILPEQHEKVYFNWLENIEPWCISRQLWWGHQIPVWYGPEKTSGPDERLRLKVSGKCELGEPVLTNLKPFCAPSHEQAVKAAEEYYGEKVEVVENQIDVGSHAIRFLGQKTNTIGITRDPDVLDTWFSSGLWPIGTLGWPEDTEAFKKYFPTDVLITGFDIIFFWVARMMMMQLETVDEIPFHTVYVHALVRDEKGKKMSKSLGNVLDPLDLVDEYGADAVRFTLTAMAAMGRDLKLSTDRIKGYRNFGTKLWNAVRFAEMNQAYANVSHTHAIRMPDACQTANKWIIGETARAVEAMDTALAAYRFNDAANGLYDHVWKKVCDWYIEFAKPLLASEDAEIVSETRATMAWALDQCMILLHPIMPFITEELWKSTAQRPDMLVVTDWPTNKAADLADPAADAEMLWVIELIEQIRSVRAETRVPVGAKIPLIQVDLDGSGQAALDRNRTLVERLARVSEFQSAETAPKGAVTLPVPGGTFCLPLADVIDIAAEKARLEKAMAKSNKEVGGLKGKLGNQKFLANAPETVVDEARTRLDDLESEAAKLDAALTRLKDME